MEESFKFFQKRLKLKSDLNLYNDYKLHIKYECARNNLPFNFLQEKPKITPCNSNKGAYIKTISRSRNNNKGSTLYYPKTFNKSDISPSSYKRKDYRILISNLKPNLEKKHKQKVEANYCVTKTLQKVDNKPIILNYTPLKTKMNQYRNFTGFKNNDKSLLRNLSFKCNKKTNISLNKDHNRRDILQGEKKNLNSYMDDDSRKMESKHNSKVIHEIKKSLDDNLKNLFNFSYDQFHRSSDRKEVENFTIK